MPKGSDSEHLRQEALARDRVRELIQDKGIRDVFVVPDRLVNIVTS